VALNLGDVTFHKARSGHVVYKYAEVRIRKSKTDQGAAGQTVALVRTPHTTSAYTWLKKLLSRCPRTLPADTPLFMLRGARLAPSDVANLVKDVVGRFSHFDPDDFAGHSLRRGGLTALSCAGAPLPIVQLLARHRDPASTAGYIAPPLHIYAMAQLAM
jgi:integrase